MIIPHLRTKYIDEKNVHVRVSTYQSGITAINLFTNNGIPLAHVTANIGNKDLVYVKDYSENEGMAKALLDAGVILPPTKHSEIPSGFVTIRGFKLCEQLQLKK
jgi:hypothetical protein